MGTFFWVPIRFERYHFQSWYDPAWIKFQLLPTPSPPSLIIVFLAKSLQQIYIFDMIFIEEFWSLNDLHVKHLQSYNNSRFSVLWKGSKVRNKLNPLAPDGCVIQKSVSWWTVQINWLVWPWVKKVKNNINFIFWDSIFHYVIHIL